MVTYSVSVLVLSLAVCYRYVRFRVLPPVPGAHLQLFPILCSIHTSYSCREHQSPQIVAEDHHKRVTRMVPMIRLGALTLTIALPHKMIPHPPTSKFRLLRLLVLHLTEIQRGGKFWTSRGAAASVIGDVSISAPILFASSLHDLQLRLWTASAIRTLHTRTYSTLFTRWRLSCVSSTQSQCRTYSYRLSVAQNESQEDQPSQSEM
jgi:hypothetical protein